VPETLVRYGGKVLEHRKVKKFSALRVYEKPRVGIPAGGKPGVGQFDLFAYKQPRAAFNFDDVKVSESGAYRLNVKKPAAVAGSGVFVRPAFKRHVSRRERGKARKRRGDAARNGNSRHSETVLDNNRSSAVNYRQPFRIGGKLLH